MIKIAKSKNAYNLSDITRQPVKAFLVYDQM